MTTTAIHADSGILIASVIAWKNGGGAISTQGIDCRKLNYYHAERIARIKHPKVRMALDNPALFEVWDAAFEKLRKAGIAKHNIHLADTTADKPATIEQGWEVCEFVEDHGVKPYPM